MDPLQCLTQHHIRHAVLHGPILGSLFDSKSYVSQSWHLQRLLIYEADYALGNIYL